MDILIEKSPNDKLEYRFITLDNNLDVLLVYDKDTQNSAASMDVGAGGTNEPIESSGLAHFLEHMLFMGSEKYPRPTDYSEYITNNGGYCNAFTDFDHTNYMFNISNDGFEKVLDMFSQFFICPLMDKDSVEKERNAVNSENEKNLQNDYWRFYQILCNFSNPDSCMNRFITGNKETLSADNIVDQLKEFHSKYYSSNLMKLSLYSNIPLDQLEQITREKFTPIVDKQVIMPNYEETIPYREEDKGYFIRMKTVQDVKELTFSWFFKSYEKDMTKPMSYFSHVLGHEGKNSILSYLIKEGLATALYASHYGRCKSFTLLDVNISLTKKGFAQYKRVIEIVYTMVNFMKEDTATNGPCAHAWDEIYQRNKLKWEFIEKYDEVSFVTNNSCNMQNHTHETMGKILKTQYDYEVFNKEEIAKITEGLTPENSFIILMAPEFEDLKDEDFTTEKWYGTKYTKEKISEEILSITKNPQVDQSNLKLCYPEPNNFFPEDLSLLPANPEESSKPSKVQDDEKMEVWFKKDDKFETPFVEANALLYFPYCAFTTTHEGYVFCEIFTKLLNDYLREFLYTAQQANANFNWRNVYDGYQFGFKCYKDTFKTFTNNCFTMIQDLDLDKYEYLFNDKREQLIKDLNNFFMAGPLNQAWTYLYAMMYQQRPTPRSQLVEAEAMTFERFKELYKMFLSSTRILWYFSGNYTREEAVAAAESAVSTLHRTPLKKHNVVATRIVRCEEGSESELISKNTNKDESNSAILMYYQVNTFEPTAVCTCKETDGILPPLEHKSHCELTHKDGLFGNMLHRILFKLLDVPAFDYLRTQKQLGYISYSLQIDYRDITGGGFVVQSSDYSPDHIQGEIFTFLNMTKDKLGEFTTEDVMNAITGVLGDLKKVDMNISDEHYNLWAKVRSHTYAFDEKEKSIHLLEALLEDKKEENIEHLKNLIRQRFMHTFIDHPRQITVKQYSNDRYETRYGEDSKVEDTQDSTSLKIIKDIITPDDIDGWKNSQSLYPDFYQSRWCAQSKCHKFANSKL